MPRRAATGEPQAGGRHRGYPGWRMVWALAVTETISYGMPYCSFAAFLPAANLYVPLPTQVRQLALTMLQQVTGPSGAQLLS